MPLFGIFLIVLPSNINMLFIMKRVLIFLITIIIFTGNAAAQPMKMKFGGNFSINLDRDIIEYSLTNKESDIKQNAFQISFLPKFYWYINEKMQFGTFVGLGFGNTATGLVNSGTGRTTIINPDGTITTTTQNKVDIGKSICWNLTPYFGYRLIHFEKLDIWAEASTYYGMYHKINGGGIDIDMATAWNTKIVYGIQVMPVIDFALTEKLAIQLHAGVIALGWYGEVYLYDNRSETKTSLDLHKGGLTGLLNSISDFGIGIVKRF